MGNINIRQDKNNATDVKRQVNVEVLRVVAMFWIVMGHYLYNYVKINPAFSAFDVNTISGLLNYSLMELLIVFTSTGVDLFVLITGYFLIEKTSFRFSGLFKVCLTTVFYACLIYLLFCLYGAHDFSWKEFLWNLSPIPVNQYWFVSRYIGMLLLAPFLSLMVSKINKKSYEILLIVLLVLFFEWPFRELFAGGMSLSWFCFLFLVGGYLKRYGLPLWIVKNIWLWVCVAAFLIFAMHTATNLLAYLKSASMFYLKYDANNSVTFFLALLVFMGFVKTSMQGRLFKCFFVMAPYTFGVYLIHEFSLMRGILWKSLAPSFLPEVPLPLHGIILCLLIFVAAILIDFLRATLFRMAGVDKLSKRLGNCSADISNNS